MSYKLLGTSKLLLKSNQALSATFVCYYGLWYIALFVLLAMGTPQAN